MKITATDGISYSVSVPRTGLTIKEFKELCRRLATAVGYNDDLVQKHFGDMTSLEEEDDL